MTKTQLSLQQNAVQTRRMELEIIKARFKGFGVMRKQIQGLVATAKRLRQEGERLEEKAKEKSTSHT